MPTLNDQAGDLPATSGSSAGCSSRPTCLVTVIDALGETQWSVDTTTDLVASLQATGADPPYSCLEGDCSACVAKVLDGHTVGDPGATLTAADVADGYILCCQSQPTSDTLTLSFVD